MRDTPSDAVPFIDWGSANLQRDGVSIRSQLGLTQHVVSGDLEAFSAAHGVGLPVGLLEKAEGQRYAARTARDRMIAVGIPDAEVRIGWNDAGYAITRMSSALHMFELSGANALAIVSRACSADPRDPGPSAAVLFAGVTACLYRYGDPETMRLHVDRALAHYLWSWMKAQSIFAA